MIKVLILSLIILILVYIIFQYDLIKISNLESFENQCFVKNQGELDVRMKQCVIYKTDNITLCDSYPELYKLSFKQLELLLILNTDNLNVEYNMNSYDKTIINNIIEDKRTKNIKDSCKFTPDNLLEIAGRTDSVDDYTNEYKRQFGCFLPLKDDEIDQYGNISDIVISKYGDDNKACIDGTNKAAVTNVTCSGANCPTNNNFHIITNFDNINNNYNINIPDNEVFLKIYDNTKVAFVKYNKSINELVNVTDVKNKLNDLYEIKYKNNIETFKYPRYSITKATTIYTDGVKVSVYSSSGDNAYNVFDNNMSSSWSTNSTTNVTYLIGYPGEFLKFDLGENIVLKNFNLHPNPENIYKSPKNFRLYGTNNLDNYNNLGGTIKIKENNITKMPTKIGNTEDYFYSFKNKETTNTITFLKDTLCDILVVGGGAAGTSGGGGGSSGGLLYYKDIEMETGTYNITIGKGGINNGENGTLSKIENSKSEISAIGGVSSVNRVGASGTGMNIDNINDNPIINTIAKKGNNILPQGTSRGGGGGSGSDAEIITINKGLNYTIYDSPGGARPSFPGNGGKLKYPTPRRTGIVPYIYHNWYSGNVLGYKPNNVIINFKGFITIPGTGVKNIIFYSRVDDGIYMKINNILILNSWRDQGPWYYNIRSSSIQFTGGETYPIDIWFYENGGGAVIELFWNIYGYISIIHSVYSTSANYGQKGGDGILNNITGKNIYYAGGGSSYNDMRLTSTVNIEKRGDNGYGGSSLQKNFTPGGDGIVIIRFKMSISAEGWNNIYDHTPGSSAPTAFYNSTLSNTMSYRYYAMIVKDNWEGTPGTSITELELYGYQQSPGTLLAIEPPAIYAIPTNITKQAYLFIFDKDGKIKEFDTNNVANFSLKDNFKNITDIKLNKTTETPIYGKISRLISAYINSKNNNNITLNLDQIDAEIVKYNADSANLGNNIPNPLSKYKQAIMNDIDISGLTFEKYDDYSRLYNGKFYMSNDDNIYIKL